MRSIYGHSRTPRRRYTSGESDSLPRPPMLLRPLLALPLLLATGPAARAADFPLFTYLTGEPAAAMPAEAGAAEVRGRGH